MRLDLIKEAVENRLVDCSVQWNFESASCVMADNKKYTLTPWRFDRRLNELRSLTAERKLLSDVCSYKSLRIENCSKDINDILYQELDICEWMLDDKIKSVYAISSGSKTLSIIAKTTKDILCSIEIATSLSNETTPVTRHELVGLEGMATDRSINEQVPVEAVYMFEDSKKNPTTFTDMEYTMLGFLPDEVKIADNVLNILSSAPDAELQKQREKRLEFLSACVKKAVQTGEVVLTEEVTA